MNFFRWSLDKDCINLVVVEGKVKRIYDISTFGNKTGNLSNLIIKIKIFHVLSSHRDSCSISRAEAMIQIQWSTQLFLLIANHEWIGPMCLVSRMISCPSCTKISITSYSLFKYFDCLDRKIMIWVNHEALGFYWCSYDDDSNEWSHRIV